MNWKTVGLIVGVLIVWELFAKGMVMPLLTPIKTALGLK